MRRHLVVLLVGCEDVAVILTVLVSDWELEECGRVLSVGDDVSFWLTFQASDGVASPSEQVQVIPGVARPLPSWPGATYDRHSVRIDLAGGALYWDAPEPFEGPVEVTGTVSSNNVDAPDGFPETRGVVRRVRMVWHELVMGPNGMWTHGSGGPRYEEVTATYFPPDEHLVLDPEAEAALARRAHQAFEREVSLGRRLPSGSFTVSLGALGAGTAPGVPVGTTETRWTGVLIDMEITGTEE